MNEPVQRYGVVGGLGASHPHLRDYVLFSAHPDGAYVLHSDLLLVEQERDGLRNALAHVEAERDAVHAGQRAMEAERDRLAGMVTAWNKVEPGGVKPPEDHWVLVYIKDHGHDVMAYVPDDMEWYDKAGNGLEGEPLHWQPLPSPPASSEGQYEMVIVLAHRASPYGSSARRELLHTANAGIGLRMELQMRQAVDRNPHRWNRTGNDNMTTTTRKGGVRLRKVRCGPCAGTGLYSTWNGLASASRRCPLCGGDGYNYSANPIPHRKRAGKKKGRVAVFWCSTYLDNAGNVFLTWLCGSRARARKYRNKGDGPLNKVMLPLPVARWKKCQ